MTAYLLTGPAPGQLSKKLFTFARIFVIFQVQINCLLEINFNTFSLKILTMDNTKRTIIKGLFLFNMCFLSNYIENFSPEPTKECQYGVNCYRKNPKHFTDFCHNHCK